ncbi:aspartyl protease family protein 2-like [Triticum dicoccoides]|uniref:aspartyl protease family protein 2-like n=1 Tax=Triticum dicoccoides TaxID=85692 RepID=UPI0018900A50|nr:aspartyl protease family protein 2-like [Triticum dicoccoides]
MSRLSASMLCFLLALLTPANLTSATRNIGFSLPLVSSHHKLNHTTGEIGELLLPEGDVNPMNIRPRVAPAGWPMFSVVVGVGSGRGQHFYKLALDFVGNLTWIRCKPCTPEEQQEGPIFDAALSPKYALVKPTSIHCKPPFVGHGHDKCSFSGTTSLAVVQGYLASDVFTFGDTGTGHRSLGGLIFGCAHRADEFWNHGIVAGAMSLNKRSTSFKYQLAGHGFDTSKFSYCLFYHGQHTAKHGFLGFGSDVPNHDHAHSTALMYHDTTMLYFIGLEGVSLNGQRLTRINRGMFSRDQARKHGGTIIDVGTPETRMIRAAYDILEAAVVADLQHRLGVRRAGYRVPGSHLCFVVSIHGIYQKLPSITLHLAGGAQLTIKWDLLFVTKMHHGAQHACFLIFPDEKMTVLGAAQQVDTRFTIDVDHRLLYFAPENCGNDSS